jgi:PleD family two-component response regulator
MAEKMGPGKDIIKTAEPGFTDCVTRKELQNFEGKLKKDWQKMLALQAGIARAELETDRENCKNTVSFPATSRVLLITSNEAISQELFILLEMAAFKVVVSQCCAEGLKEISGTSLILLDEDLPDYSTMCLHLREITGAPIILLCAEPGAETWKKAVEAGVDACLKKSMSRMELLARFRSIMRRYNCTN